MIRFPTRSFLNRTLLGAVVSGFFLAKASAAEEGGAESVGYYPTYEESGILATGDYDYLRSSGGALAGPDLDRWASTGGIWPYEYEAGGLSRLQRFLQPVDYILRPLTPGETIALQGPLSESSFQLGASFPFLTRTYHTEKSTFADMFGLSATQYSPFFFDVLAISALAAYVDTSGIGGGAEDGFLSALSIDLRAGWKLTDRTSLIVAGQVYFVISPDADVQFYVDAGGLTSFVNLNYQIELGSWDLRVFDDLTPFSTRKLLNERAQSGGIQRAGNLNVGIPDSIDSGDWWDSRNQFLVNTAGFTAGTFIGETLRFLAGFGRSDVWRWDDFEDLGATEYVSAGLFYDGYGLWMAPSLTYNMSTNDFENPNHLIALNVTAPISPNISMYGGIGYQWGDSYDGEYLSLGLTYNQTARLTHSLVYSSGYNDSLVGDDFIGQQIGYGVHYAMGPRITLGGYAGWYLADGGGDDAEVLSGYAAIALGNYSNLTFQTAYVTSGGQTGDQWVYNITFARQLATRLNAQLSYEYLNAETYEQSTLMLRLTRVF